MKVSSNLRFLTSPLQYFLKCLSQESSLPSRVPPHARHVARFPILFMCLPHSHFPRNALSHPLQHHFFRIWLNMGAALQQLGSGVGDGLGDTGWSSGVDEVSESEDEGEAGERRGEFLR